MGHTRVSTDALPSFDVETVKVTSPYLVSRRAGAGAARSSFSSLTWDLEADAEKPVPATFIAAPPEAEREISTS